MSQTSNDYGSATAVQVGLRIIEKCFWSLLLAGVPIAVLNRWLQPAVGQSVYRLESPHPVDGLGIESLIGWLSGVLLAGWSGGSPTSSTGSNP